MTEPVAPTTSEAFRGMALRAVIWCAVAIPCGIGISRLFTSMHWPGKYYATSAVILSNTFVLNWQPRLTRAAWVERVTIWLVIVLIAGYLFTANNG